MLGLTVWEGSAVVASVALAFLIIVLIVGLIRGNGWHIHVHLHKEDDDA